MGRGPGCAGGRNDTGRVARLKTVGQVLVVDDSKMSSRKLALAPRSLGHDAVEVNSGQAALDLLRERDFDLILLDILMPGMDGFEVLGHLRAEARLAEIPVLVISGLENDTDSVARAIELGATDFCPSSSKARRFGPVSTPVSKRSGCGWPNSITCGRWIA